MLISFKLDTLPGPVWEQDILRAQKTLLWAPGHIRGCGREHSRVGVWGRGQGDRNRDSSTSVGSLYLTPSSKSRVWLREVSGKLLSLPFVKPGSVGGW